MKLKYQLFILLLICGLNFFTNNQYLDPDIMEARNLITAKEMVQKGNWFNPTMNDYPRLAKPPFPTWINGFIAKYYPVTELSIHRIPGALIGTFMVIAIFFIARVLFRDSLLPFFSGCIAASSYYIILMSRQATWDIYCHALMTGAICFLLMGWSRRTNFYLWHIIAGILMGLSFLSKGPVSFYALLLPFLASWTLFVDRSVFKNNWKAILLCTIICLIISLSWPFHLYNINPEGLLKTINSETEAWSNRHVRPFYQYWGFWSHIGIWSTFALAALFYPYAKKRIPDNYKFLFWWTMLVVILLSIPAEKKERYLIPVLVPLSILTGSYIFYLYNAWKKNELSLSDKNIIRFTTIALILVCAIIPTYLFLESNMRFLMILTSIVCFILFAVFIFSLFKFNLRYLLIAIIILMTSFSILMIPQVNSLFIYKNPQYESLSKLKDRSLYQYKFFSPFVNPKQILQLGKSVDTLHILDGIIDTPDEEQFVVISEEPIDKRAFNPRIRSLLAKDTIAFDPESGENLLYLYFIDH